MYATPRRPNELDFQPHKLTGTRRNSISYTSDPLWVPFLAMAFISFLNLKSTYFPAWEFFFFSPFTCVFVQVLHSIILSIPACFLRFQCDFMPEESDLKDISLAMFQLTPRPCAHRNIALVHFCPGPERWEKPICVTAGHYENNPILFPEISPQITLSILFWEGMELCKATKYCSCPKALTQRGCFIFCCRSLLLHCVPAHFWWQFYISLISSKHNAQSVQYRQYL